MRAVDGVDLCVEPGEVVGVVGANGAGKTTLIDAITGFVPSAGTVDLGGQDLSAMSAHARARAGIARSWQSLELIEDLSVLDNLRTASDSSRWWSSLIDLVRPGRDKPTAAMLRAIHALGSRRRAGEDADRAQHRQAQAGCARACDRERAVGPSARRTLLRTRSPRAARGRECDQDAGRALGRGRAAGRARRPPGQARVRPDRGAGLREGDRRGPARSRAIGSRRDGGVPRGSERAQTEGRS